MKARDVIGKRVARVVQTFINDGEHPPAWEIDRLIFTDGSYLYFSVNEHIGDYGVSAHFQPARKEMPDSPRLTCPACAHVFTDDITSTAGSAICPACGHAWNARTR